MFPLYDSIKSRNFAFLNFAIVVFTVWIFLQQIFTSDPLGFINQYALTPSHVNFADASTLIPFITAIFLHGGILHILSNMWFLIVFGDNVNDTLGVVGFLLLYFTAGIVGNIVQYMFTPGSNVPMLGASGAVAGILGCYYVLFPHAKVKTLVFILFFVTILEISAPFLLGYWFILQIFSGVVSIESLGNESGGVAFFAHIAGFVVGLLFGYFYKNRANKGELYERSEY